MKMADAIGYRLSAIFVLDVHAAWRRTLMHENG
jgi:hypothetical protein